MTAELGSSVSAIGRSAFLEYFDGEIAKHPEDKWRTAGRKTKANPNGDDINWWRTNGQDMADAYLRWRRMNQQNLVIWDTPTGVPAIELEVNIVLQDGTMLRGFIDRVFQDFSTGELLAVDLKTGTNVPTPIQLATYRLALEQTFGFSPKFGAYWMARKGTLDEIHDLDRFPPEMVSRWLRDTRRQIQAGFFTPHVTRMCDYCGVKDHCYAQNPAAFTPDFNDDLTLERN